MENPVILPPTDNPDRVLLRKIGKQVRRRLAENPAVYQVPAEAAEIWAVGDFLSPVECARMVEIIDAAATPSLAFDVDYSSGFRTSYSANPDPHDAFVQQVQRRIDDLLGIDPALGEMVQGQRYAPGQQFKPHTDWFHTDTSYWPTEKRRGGQRSLTAMAYLNPVEEGGNTEFPTLGFAFEPTPGALLIWNNADRLGVPNPAVLHAGRPVVRGVKYVITKWYRARPWR